MRSFNKVRLLLTVILSIIIVLAILVYLLRDKPSEESLNLLEYPSSLVFGNAIKIDESPIKEFQLNEEGESALFIQIEPFESSEFPSLNFEISELDNNYQVVLVWINNYTNEVNELRLFQPDDTNQFVPLKHHENWKGTIQQIGIRVLPRDHLGLSISNSNNISIKKLNLMSMNWPQTMQSISDHWLDYDSLSYKSINHIKMSSVYPEYAHPIVFVALCLLLVGLIYIKFKVVLIGSFLLSWLFLDLLFLKDMNDSKTWVLEKSLNSSLVPDQDLLKLANEIKTSYGLNSQKTPIEKDPKIFVISSSRYVSLRLMYHLHPMSASYINQGSDPAIFTHAKPDDLVLIYEANGQPLRPSNNVLDIHEGQIKVEEVNSGPMFSLMKVIE